MKTIETEDLEQRLMRRYFKPGTHIVFEVSLEQARHLTCIYGSQKTPPEFFDLDYPGIADAMVSDNYGNISCFELKVTKSDFHSDAKLSFVGHMNYYVMPRELYGKVKDQIPDFVGVFVPFGEDSLESVKKAKRQEMKYDVRAVLVSMLTAASNKTTVRNIYRFDKGRFEEPERQKKLFLSANHRYARLCDGTIEPLYYESPNGGLDLKRRRQIDYDEGQYSLVLNRSVNDGKLKGFATIAMPIVEFLEERQ